MTKVPRFPARDTPPDPAIAGRGEKRLAILAMLGRKTELRAPQGLPRPLIREGTPKMATRWSPGHLGDAVRLGPSAGGRADGVGEDKTSCLNDSRPHSLSLNYAKAFRNDCCGSIFCRLL